MSSADGVQDVAANTEGQRFSDGIAIGAAILCLIHCLLLPVLIILLPTLTAFLAIPETFHVWALAVAAPVSLLALATGYRRHRWLRPTMIVLPGLMLLALGALLAPTEAAEAILSASGALLLALGHALNWRALRARETPENGIVKV